LHPARIRRGRRISHTHGHHRKGLPVDHLPGTDPLHTSAATAFTKTVWQGLLLGATQEVSCTPLVRLLSVSVTAANPLLSVTALAALSDPVPDDI
jgi:hypothetical protein